MRPVCRHEGGSQGGPKMPRLHPSQNFSPPLGGQGMMWLAWPTGGPDVTLTLPPPDPPLPHRCHQMSRICLLPLTLTLWQ